jgi:hypothetical protein
MTKVDEDRIPSIWKLQAAPKVVLTPDLIRARAARLDEQVRKRVRVDVLSCVGVVICCVFAAVLSDGVVLRTGLLLLAGWAAMGAWLIRLLGVPDRLPGEPTACAAWYIRHLERERDYLLSAPWGLGLALPGLVLIYIGYSTPPGVVPWQHSLALGGLTFFVYFAYVIYAKLVAGRWQQEIDSLRSASVPVRGV